jgi:hypothetical protein
MKKLIIVLFLLISASVYSQVGQWNTFTFVTGDTTETITVANAKTLFITIRDSAMTGLDSCSLYLVGVSPISSQPLMTKVAMHDISQATQTTNTVFLEPGAGITKTFILTSEMWGGPITGTFQLNRDNTRTGEAAYAPKTRGAWKVN